MTVPVIGVVASSTSYAQSVVRDIKVVGNKRVEPETVRSYLQLSPGDEYDSYKVDQSLKALFATGLFADVQIDQDGSTLVVTVVENPVINRVAFEGNSEVEDATLEAEVQLKARSIFTKARVQADVQRILAVYQSQGLYGATVEPKIIELEQNRVDLVFEINEGPSTKVQSISFIGNKAFSDSSLREVVTTTETNWFSFLKSTDIYDADRLNLDKELLRQFYLKNGYADVQIVSAVADLDRSGDGFYLTFTIEEGEVYSFGAVTIESNIADIQADTLTGEVLTQQGETYNATEIEKSVERMTIQVAENGNAFAQIRPRVDRDPVSRTIGITYVVEEGQRIYIERINVIGNTRTRDWVIRREFRLAEGDAFNRLLVDRAKKRLQALGFFKAVDVTAEQGSAPDRIVLNVMITEDSTGELSFGGGYSTSEGIIADVTFKERNLMGRGQFLQVKLGGSLEGRKQIDVNFTEPRFLDQNLSAGVDLFHKEVDLTKEAGYSNMRTGAGLRLGVPLSDETWITGRYTFSREEVFDVQDDASLFVKESEGTDFVSAVGYTLSYDTRNIKANPTSGIYLELAQDFAGLGGDVNYIRTVAEARGYYPITDQITFVTRVTGGQIEGWGGQDVRLSDLFYRGGETVRGFDKAGYGPRDAKTGDALGGKLFYAATAEVRFPLPYVPDDLGLSGAVFADAGSLFTASDRAKELDAQGKVDLQDSDSIRSSVGVSLIWNSPLGPLRADYAYVLTKEAFDDEQAFRFGASTRF
ncbi:MAG: outer membrane protein assembly factor BamA [Hyphomicrobiaceae bacterium]